MIEMLGVLAIIGVLSVGGIAGYSKAMEKFKINKTIDQVTHIATNIRTLYAQQTSYNGLWDNNVLKTVVPEELWLNDWTIQNAFGGYTTVSTASGIDYYHFYISLTNITKMLA